MKRPAEVTEFLRCGGPNCDGACNTHLDKLGVEDCLTWRVHGYIQKLEERIVHLESLNQQNLSVITMQERTRSRLEEQISQLEARVPRWISVEERLPEGEVIAANFAPGTYGYKEYLLGYVHKHDDLYYAENSFEILNTVTHWRPRPEPLKEE